MSDGSVWTRLVDPDCQSIARPRYNHTDPETTELDLSHIQLCPRCMDFLMEEEGIVEPNI